MGLSVGELFVNLGVKGADNTVGALNSIKSGLGSVGSASLEAKAALLAVFYVIEKLTVATGKVGSSLINFSTLTGISAKTLQQYQYAAQQVGVSNEEVTSSFKGLQSAMTQIALGRGAPEGLKLMSLALAKMGNSIDFNKIRDTTYVMGKLNDLAKSGMLSDDIERWAVGTTGITEGMLAAMKRGAFSPESLAKAPTYSASQLRGLDKAYVAWMNLVTHIERAFGALNAAHGAQLVQDLTKVSDSIIRLTENLTILSEKLKVFQALTGVFNLIANVFGVVGQETYGNPNAPNRKAEGYFGPLLDWRDKVDQSAYSFWHSMAPKEHTLESQLEHDIGNIKPLVDPRDYITNPIISTPQNATPIKVEIKQMPGAKDKLQVKHSQNSAGEKAVNYALRQQSTLLQGA